MFCKLYKEVRHKAYNTLSRERRLLAYSQISPPLVGYRVANPVESTRQALTRVRLSDFFTAK